MNKLIICTIMLLVSNLAFAEDLYRWTEPDGSITFSPTPPTTGVQYEKVSAISSAIPKEPQSSGPSILATSEHDNVDPLARINDAQASVEPAEVIQRPPLLNYAPELNSGITRSAVPEAAAATDAADDGRPKTIVSDKKQQQCLDLSKRVTSLERRLRSKLDWDDMDNTVIAMARYQRSFDQHCTG